jgi:hypothetical protein
MIETARSHELALAANRLAVLGRDFQAHIINYSPNGCLLETNAPLEVGTVGTLRFIIDGRPFADDVQVVRCQAIEGAGSQYQVGAKFLWTMTGGVDSLRSALSLMMDGHPIKMVG